MSRPVASALAPRLCRARLACLCFALALSPYALALRPALARTIDAPRERVSLDADWRFQKGDPAGTEGRLAYEKIKNWVTATGNEFVLSSGVAGPDRPTRSLGEDVSYTRANFDDKG